MTRDVNCDLDDSVDPLVELARTCQAHGYAPAAREAFEQAIALAPHRADLMCELGNVCQELNDPESALNYYQQSIQVEPDFIPARQNLGYLLSHHGEPEQAREHYEHALSVLPTPMSRMLAATLLPVIYESVADLEAWRTRFEEQVSRHAAAGVRVETSRSQIPTNFLLAYQGRNDRDVAANLGRIYAGVDLVPAAGGRPLAVGRDGRLRVGFLSAYFHDHTIGRLNLGRIRHLSRQRFHVTVLSAGAAHDEVARAFVRAADRFVPVPRNVEAARQTIVELGLDVLIFADVGMDSITTTLAYSRMAPVQCLTWGHPDTSGSPGMDYFLSSELLDSPAAQAHYTETLIRLPWLGIYYERPLHGGPTRQRSYFGLAEGSHVYVCPQTLYKFHPSFDAILSGILQSDPQGEIVLLEGRIQNWTDRLKRRFQRTLRDANQRVRFLPAQSHSDYLSLLAVSDVVLDPLHFGGGNSSYEALAMGVPVVTWPSEFLRGRITAALYEKMGYRELVVSSPEEYIARACQLALDPRYRSQVCQMINSTNHVLFNDLGEVAGLEVFLWSLTGMQHSNGAIEQKVAEGAEK